MINLCVIPARGGSRRIPKKNIREFFGKPIIAYSIEAAKASGLFQYIVVSTDDEEIAAVAKEYGAWAIMRPPHLAKDEVGTREVTIETLNQVRHNTTKNPDAVCCLYATAPMLSVDDLMRGYELLRLDRYVHAISIGYPNLRDAAQFYWSDGWALTRTEYFGPETVLVPVSADRICDINLEEDWSKAEKMYVALHERK